MQWSDLKWLYLCDSQPGDAGYNMAMDEVLLHEIHAPVIRIYQWARPTVTFGYFEKLQEVQARWKEVHLMRRWTGGGQVDHRSDFTYTVMLPADSRGKLPLAHEAYGWIHRRIALALQMGGVDAFLATEDAQVPNGPCFVKPVKADIMLDDHKIAGAAQRRNRIGMLHQGSIQKVVFPSNWNTLFLQQFPIAGEVPSFAELEVKAKRLAKEKYNTRGWIEKF